MKKLDTARKGHGTLKPSGRISALATDKSENPQKRSYKVSGGRTPRNVGRPTGESPFSPHSTAKPRRLAYSGTFVVPCSDCACDDPTSKTSRKGKKTLGKFLQRLWQKIWGPIPWREVK